jgi:hypothetical protein
MANSAVTYTWSAAIDTGIVKSPVSYVIEFAGDVDFNTILQTQKSGVTTLQHTFDAVGIYYWRVRAIDAAGNIGENSTAFRLNVN